MSSFSPFAKNTKAKVTEPERSSNSRTMFGISVVDERKRATDKPSYSVLAGRVSSGNEEDYASNSTAQAPVLMYDIGRSGKNVLTLSIPEEIPEQETVRSFTQHNDYGRYGSKTKYPPGVVLALKGIGSSVWTKALTDKELKALQAEGKDRIFHIFHTASSIQPVVLKNDHLEVVAGASNFADPLLDLAPATISAPWENATQESHRDKPISKKGKKYNEYDQRAMLIRNDFDAVVGLNQGLDDKEEIDLLLKDMPEDSPEIVELQQRTYPNQELCKASSGSFALPADRTIEEADTKFQTIIVLTDKDDETKKTPLRAFKRIMNVLQWEGGAFASPGSKTTYAQVNVMAYDGALEPFNITNHAAWSTLGPLLLTYANYTMACSINFSETANLPEQSTLQAMEWQDALQSHGRTMDAEALAITFMIDLAHELARLGVPVRADDAKRHLNWTTGASGDLKASVDPSSAPTIALDKLPKFGSPVINLSEFSGDPRPFFPADPADSMYVFVALTNHKMNASRLSTVVKEFTREERAALMDYTTIVKLRVAAKRNATPDAVAKIIDENLERQGLTKANAPHYTEVKSILSGRNFEGEKNELVFNIFAIAHPLIRDDLTLTPAFREVCGAMTEHPREALAEFHRRFDWEATRVFGDHLTLTAEMTAARAKGDAALIEALKTRYGDGLVSLKRAREADDVNEKEEPIEKRARNDDSSEDKMAVDGDDESIDFED